MALGHYMFFDDNKKQTQFTQDGGRARAVELLLLTTGPGCIRDSVTWIFFCVSSAFNTRSSVSAWLRS